ncbi:MAG TPA: adenylate/guanylate cyclase domain-containing protein [Chthoniobacterales bacterium]
MSSGDSPQVKFEIGHVLFIDIVGYSKLLINEQSDQIQTLKEIVRGSEQVRLAEEERKLLRLPTGDGAALVFRNNPEAPVLCALEISKALKSHPELRVRMGIHSGPVNEVTDLNEQSNISGAGINIAQRVMDCGDAGHILLSKRVADDLEQYPQWRSHLTELGEYEVKHGARVSVVNLYTDEIGNRETPQKVKAGRESSGSRTRTYGIVLVSVLALALLLGWIFYRLGQRRSVSQASDVGPHMIQSIAVLPLDNYSADPQQEYFVEGMTDELTTDLATISQLRVISRSSTTQFKGGKRPATPEIARLLNVDAVVEGSVQRAGDKVRINAQLIDARADRHLWAKSFERDSRDVLALQNELASAIAAEINVQLTPGEKTRLTTARPVNPEAYDAYLEGRYFFNRPSDENLSKAITQFQQAIALDPNFAPAYSGLSDAYLWAAFNEGVIIAKEGGPRAKAAAEKALELSPDSAEAHTSLANYKSWYQHDWAGADKEFRQAVALNPNYAFAHDQWALSMGCEGRFDESIAEGKRARELDPLDPAIAVDNTLAFAGKGEFQKATDEARRGAELDPMFFFPQMQLGWIALQQGNVRAAIPELEKAAKMESPPFATAYLGYAYGAVGDRARALATIEALKKKSVRGYVPPFNLAIVYLGLGDLERAMDLLEQASADDSQWMMYLKIDRIFDPLRTNPRFIALMKRCHFDQ